MRLKTLIFLAILSLITSSAEAGLRITCSLFPVYDFARAVVGGSANVHLLLKPGTEPHEYEPSPMDVKTLNDSDVFIFTGRHMEHWAGHLADTLTGTAIIDASENISLTDNDPHIWMDLKKAQAMIRNILEGLCRVDPENREIYTANAESYCAKLSELDAKFMALPKDRALVFAGEFSCGYFVRRYGFEYVSAFDGENEPGIRKLAEVIRHINSHHTRFILSDLPIPPVTRSISEQTAAKILAFSTAHLVEDTSRTFLEIMTGNYENLTRVLND